MTFKERRTASTKVDIQRTYVPTIGIYAEALTKMGVYVDQCADEIGWLGTAYRNEDNNTYVVKDVFLFDQEVHATTTEITPEGLTDFAEELLTQGDEGMEIWNNLKVWGHSHVNMGVTPSGQDDKQMETFQSSGYDWFIRIIANKKGELKVDLYDYTDGIIYLDVPWVEIPTEVERDYYRQIEELEAKIYEVVSQREEEYAETIKEEMKTKVRKKTYSTYQKKTTYLPNNRRSGTNGSKVTTGTGKEKVDETPRGFFATDAEVFDGFSYADLEVFSHMWHFQELKEELEYYGYDASIGFTDDDVERVYKIAYQVGRNYNGGELI